ncbi:MAG: hypothetical protein KJ850_01025 [Gammaproteobacteria bacterium]|nr:hypothetical protein [Gammaproteobacteria bacterium]MBU1623605.1 hypothetical protein [Gammaproteobacteria bacterium]
MNVRLMMCASVMAMAGSFSIPAMADGSICLKTFSSMITAELDAAYKQQGHPQPSFENFGKVKDIGMSHLEAKVSKWPEDATFSISVLDDRITFAVFCPGKMQEGEWKP